MNTKTIAVLLIAIVTQGADAPIPKAMRDAITKSLSSQLKDPYSAQITDLRIAKHKPSPNGDAVDSVCGMVNAKNAYGAYVGQTPFQMTVMAFKDKAGKTFYMGLEPIIAGHDKGDLGRFYGVLPECKPY